MLAVCRQPTKEEFCQELRNTLECYDNWGLDYDSLGEAELDELYEKCITTPWKNNMGECEEMNPENLAYAVKPLLF